MFLVVEWKYEHFFQLARQYKLEFLQILVSHEHWLPLNLPILFDLTNKPLLGLPKIEEHGQDGKHKLLSIGLLNSSG